MSLALLQKAPFAPGKPYAIDANVLHRLLDTALSQGGDYADLFFEYCVSSQLFFEEEKVKNVGRGITLGLGIRVLSGDATGYAYTENLDLASMQQTAKTAAAIASYGQKVSPQAVVLQKYADRYSLSSPSTFVPPQKKLALLREADRGARAFDTKIAKVQVGLADNYREICIANSDGILVADAQPMLRMSVSTVAESQDKKQKGSSGGGGRMGLEYFSQKSPELIGKEAARVAIAMLDARPAPAGEMEVVLAPGDSGILLHEAIGHGLEADFNRKKTSNYTDCIGKSVASSLCTVVDDSTLQKSRGSINVDDEGNEPKRNVLIENGILRDYLHDRLSSQHFQRPPGGNGRRQSFRHIPMPRMTNTYMLAGESDPEDIIRSVKKGVYAVRFSGGQVNISNGDFVFSLTESYLIEDGKLTSPLTGVNLIGNGPDVLTKVSEVGNDFRLSDGTWTCGKEGQSVPVGVGIPTVKLSAITVGGTEVNKVSGAQGIKQ